MKITSITGAVHSTSDCKKALDEFKKSTWKRIHKSKWDDTEVRVFTDGIDTHTITVDSFTKEGKVFHYYDFQKDIPLLTEVVRLANFYYTHDYGAIHFSPLKRKLHIEGGDGGYVYDTRNKVIVLKEFEDDWNSEEDTPSTPRQPFIDFHEQPTLSELDETVWEAESPPDEQEEPDYFTIGTINLFD